VKVEFDEKWIGSSGSIYDDLDIFMKGVSLFVSGCIILVRSRSIY
jgi:hypothetical protein